MFLTREVVIEPDNNHKVTLEKNLEFNNDEYQLFANFRQANDRITRDSVWLVLEKNTNFKKDL